jgi:hypothetical protein
VKPPTQVSHGDDPMLSLAKLAAIDRVSEIELYCAVKSETTLAEIALVLPWIERDLHSSNSSGKQD